ncbi:DUF7115 domain-containing protein [Halobacterium sp. KA-6]|uniref:DUF7115 domain-containing protein n=1 Tax=Halobacterium sp. KA-6 TaxID=2896368 RepID=UPI001E57CE61|nr:PH domain-containing protein [Halobacterium sp. KA-6]MCD2204324.1 hypothetical protein [Halobacterium sp. KA-6]
MNVPALVQSSLGDEDVAAHVPLKGEDAVFVTPTRTLVYTADGLLSDETVDEFPHDAEGIKVSEGRRKSKITLDYGLDGEESFSVPSGKLDDVLHPIIAGVLNAADVTQPGETVKRTYQFSELTLVVTSDRVVKHVGAAIWGPDYEEIDYDSVTGIDIEEGNVSSQLVLETTARTQRIKAPNEQFRDVRETVENAVYAFHNAANADEFERMNVNEDAGTATKEVSFESGVEPIDTSGVGEDDEAATNKPEANTEVRAETGRGAGSAASATQEPAERPDVDDDEFASSGFQTAATQVEPPVDPEELNAELADLEDTIEELADVLAEQRELAERQREALDAQQTVIEAQRDRLAALRDLVDEE